MMFGRSTTVNRCFGGQNRAFRTKINTLAPFKGPIDGGNQIFKGRKDNDVWTVDYRQSMLWRTELVAPPSYSAGGKVRSTLL